MSLSQKVFVVVGSSGTPGEFSDDSCFVVDFSNSKIPPPFQLGVGACVVDCYETLAAVGNTGNGDVAIYDVSMPTVPEVASASTPFAGISSIAFYGRDVVVGEAGQAGAYRRIALIDVANLIEGNPESPQIYNTSLDTLTGVAIFGQYVVVSGTVAAPLIPDGPSYYDAYQVTSIKTVETETGVETKLSSLSDPTIFGGGLPPIGVGTPTVTCDFDGTNAAFSDGVNVYVFRISNGIPTKVPIGGPYGALSATIAEIASGPKFPGGFQVATAGELQAGQTSVAVTYTVPSQVNSPETNLGDLASNYPGAVKFSRLIDGTSTLLAAAGVNGGKYVVELFSVTPKFNGAGTTVLSITANQEGSDVSVPLPITSTTTIGVATFTTETGPIPPLPRPIKLS